MQIMTVDKQSMDCHAQLAYYANFWVTWVFWGDFDP